MPGSKLLLEMMFRSVKGEKLINSSDSIHHKNYFNNNKAEIEKELD